MALAVTGCYVQHDSDNNDTYTSITDSISIEAPEVVTEEIKTTTLADLWHTYMGGRRDGQTLSFSMRFNKTTLNTLEGFGKTTIPWKLLFGDNSDLSFDGFIKSLKYGAIGEEGDVTCDVQIKVTGEVTFTPAS